MFVAALDVALGPDVAFEGLQVAWPLLAAAFLPVRAVIGTAALATVFAVAVGPTQDDWPGLDYTMRGILVAAGGALAVWLAAERSGTRRSKATIAEKLRESEASLRLLVEGVREHAFFSVDREATIVGWNAGAERLFGYRADQVVGRSARILHAPDAQEAGVADAEFEQAARYHESGAECWHARADGSQFWGLEVVTAVVGADGEPAGFVKLVRDATTQREAQVEASEARAELAHRALHDPLTGLPNRALLLDRLIHTLHRRHRGGGIAVLFLDLDEFKVVNDSLGHAVGDELLVEVAQRIGAAVRPEDTVARLGGDEFVVFCENVDTDTACVIAERVVVALRAPFALAGRQLVVTTSIGITVTQSGALPGDLLRDADAAMYVAKTRGRDRVALFDEEVRQRVVARLDLEADLRQAVGAGELRVHFQPVFDLAWPAVVAVEALVRWQHPRRGLLSPSQFIEIAEASGLIIPVGAFVLEAAVAQAQQWKEMECDLTVWVNVSARQLVEDGFARQVADLLEAHAVEPDRLGLELTERVLMEVTSGTELDELARLGVQLAIDDFGTGYSSLSYLQRYHVDVLKVDRSFVAGLPANADARAIVDAVVGLAHALGATASAEGVENTHQLDALRDAGCDTACGYLLARPAPPEEIDLRHHVAWQAGRLVDR